MQRVRVLRDGSTKKRGAEVAWKSERGAQGRVSVGRPEANAAAFAPTHPPPGWPTQPSAEGKALEGDRPTKPPT